MPTYRVTIFNNAAPQGSAFRNYSRNHTCASAELAKTQMLTSYFRDFKDRFNLSAPVNSLRKEATDRMRLRTFSVEVELTEIQAATRLDATNSSYWRVA